MYFIAAFPKPPSLFLTSSGLCLYLPGPSTYNSYNIVQYHQYDFYKNCLRKEKTTVTTKTTETIYVHSTTYVYCSLDFSYEPSVDSGIISLSFLLHVFS